MQNLFGRPFSLIGGGFPEILSMLQKPPATPFRNSSTSSEIFGTPIYG